MKPDGQSNVVYIIYDKVELEFVYQYRTIQYNVSKGIFKSLANCKNVCDKLNQFNKTDRYVPYELTR